ncbi:hypothetical protein VZT92_003140 [Zoarces viviparus]|uniref:Ig-like domain-containing protein n=1 Tax=Zoarces viviparus TaxID=48416 RepID=A0AAW1G1J4_ZOAVI
MFFRFILLVVSSMSFLRSVSSCEESCTDKPVFTPSRLVVRIGDPTFASCSVCQHDCINNLYKLESPVGLTTTNGTTISWTVNRLTEWHASPICYYTIRKTNDQCCTTLPVTVYQPPVNVSISFVGPTGPMREGQQCTLQCTVEDVAPVENLTVTFYRGRTALSQQSNISNTEKKPVTDIFSLNITLSKEDDGVQYWCEAKLELGPDGPQRPPVVTSQNITTTVLYGPQLVELPHLDPNIVVKGGRLELSCSAVGNPSPSYTWTLPPESTSTSNSSILTINSATFADEGNYTCSVSNGIGNVTVQFDVAVRGLELTSTRLPPTTTPATTTRSTTPATTTRSTTPATTTRSTTPATTTRSTTPATTTRSTTPATTTRSTTPTTNTTSTRANVLNCSTSSFLLHRFIMCFMLLFSALV